MLAGLPGETLIWLAGRTERQALAPGERLSAQGHFVAMISGLGHATDEGGGRETIQPGAVLGDDVVSLLAVTPVTVVRCERATLDEALQAPREEA